MRIIDVPARYAAFVEQTLAAMKATIDADVLMSDGEQPWPTGTIPKNDARGTLLIFAARMPQELAQPVFPQVEQPAPLERSA